MKQFVQTQDYNIASYTKGEGETIIFLHGWPTNSKLWSAQVNALNQKYKTITLDWLGFGQSDKPIEHHYTFPSQKNILDKVLSTLLDKDEKVTLVAHDIGGPPAILWASENEERVKCLILLNTVIYTFKTPMDAFSEILMKTPILRDIFASPFGLRQIMKSNTKTRGGSLNSRLSTILEAYKNESRSLKIKTIHDPLEEGRKNNMYFLNEKFRKLNTNKYFVIAKADPLCFKHIKKLSEENPEVPTYYIKNCGHFIPADQPDALNEILLKIID